MHKRVAYLPISTYPETVADDAILAAASYAAALGFDLHITAFSVDIPQLHSPLGGLLLDVPALARSAEQKSKAECQRLKALLDGAQNLRDHVHFSIRHLVLGAALDSAAAEARHYDLSVLPWSADSITARDLSEAVVFGSGRPAILVPAAKMAASIHHIAIAWDASRVAARALGDALSLLPDGGHISVLTVKDEKPLTGPDIAETLVSFLKKRGFKAEPCVIDKSGKGIAQALQDTAIAQGAQLLAMGGFGHSRVRDFVLGGATKGVFSHLQMPVLLSH
jgi:nucleotide-binding universal stress UspA family protein